MKIVEGSPAPDFSLPDQDGTVRSLSDYRGKWVLLYFYPKDDTPGCTTEACALRDLSADYDKLGIEVLGVSTDAVAKHAKFQAKYDLPFTLLSDPSHEMIDRYGAWREKKFMGRTYMGTARVSFLLDSEGKVRKAYEEVKPAAHAAQVLGDAAASRP